MVNCSVHLKVSEGFHPASCSIYYETQKILGRQVFILVLVECNRAPTKIVLVLIFDDSHPQVTTMNKTFWLSVFFVTMSMQFTLIAPANGDLSIDLVHEFDGNSNGVTSFGTIELSQNGSSVDFEIIANTTNLVGGDIQELYFNLPNSIDVNSLVVSGSGGVSNHTINPFTTLGANPNVTGGSGASFDTGINFGNGGGPPGNGTLTTATFSLTATGGLLVSDLVSETSTSNNAPPVFMAVHFQSADVFGNGSETVGGIAIPEPSALILLAISGVTLLHRRR